MTATPAEATVNERAWKGFEGGLWRDAVDVRDFGRQNYTPYEGDGSFLAGPTERTTAVWKAVTDRFPEERAKGVYDVAYDIPSTITAHAPGWIDRDKDLIVGLRTDAPLKRAIMPYGGRRMVAGALETYGCPVSEELEKVSVDTSSVQYESDEPMRPRFGDDTAIACRVSAMPVGRRMQFFGARVNLAKTLLYAIDGGRDEKSGAQVGPATGALRSMETGASGVLGHDEVMARFDEQMERLAGVYVHALNVLHHMHDTYAYERVERALHDRDVRRTMACGIAGLSVAADSLAAVTYAKVTPVRDETGLATDHVVEGDHPAYGDNDERADEIAVWLVEEFLRKVRKHPTYRNAEHTRSVLTITSDVVYGKKTGDTPDGRRAGEPFSPGANPMNGRDTHGYVASALSAAELPYEDAEDGISLTDTVTPDGLGRTPGERIRNLAGVLDGYMAGDGFHTNVNVLDREVLEDAVEHPENHPQLTIRVSGCAVNFVRLTREQQPDVLNRTFHGSL
ncbi:pyruvate formate lyase family protein [Streptomyces sp. NPDC004284]|uniref:pyruvate formate lyase family protein n=1 Tax=Streptomyces sp. NPDC004284 TaxID=3364695 RepID=UPI0036AE5DCF